MSIIIGDVHQFIGHCLIPLDPWIGPNSFKQTKQEDLNFIKYIYLLYVESLFGHNDYKTDLIYTHKVF